MPWLRSPHLLGATAWERKWRFLVGLASFLVVSPACLGCCRWVTHPTHRALVIIAAETLVLLMMVASARVLRSLAVRSIDRVADPTGRK